MVKFIRGSFEDYKTLYIDGSDTPDSDTIYYLTDTAGHQHIFMNEKEYAVTPVVYGQEDTPLSPPTVLLTQNEYDTLKNSVPTQIDENTLYLIYEPSLQNN